MRIAALGLTLLVLVCVVVVGQNYLGEERATIPDEPGGSAEQPGSSTEGQAGALSQADQQAQASAAASAAPPASPRKPRADLENCKKVRWVNRATPGFGGGPMTMSRVAVCAD